MSLFKSATNSNSQGNIGMACAIAWFAKNGYTVCIPLTDTQEFDIIVDKSGKSSKIQIKTTRYKKDGKTYSASLSTDGKVKKKFDPSMVDYVFVVTEIGSQYLIPTNGMNNCSSITLGDKYKSYIVE